MSGEMEMEFLHAIRDLESISPIPRWSLCAGSGVARLFFDVLSDVWASRYNVNVQFRAALYCEINPKKQSFINWQHEPTWLVSDMKELAADSALNINSMEEAQSREILPYVVSLDCGVIYISRTRLSG